MVDRSNSLLAVLLLVPSRAFAQVFAPGTLTVKSEISVTFLLEQ